MTPVNEPLAQAVRENDGDDTPRVMYADWLEEEHGGEERCKVCKGHGWVKVEFHRLSEAHGQAIQWRERPVRGCTDCGQFVFHGVQTEAGPGVVPNDALRRARFIRAQVEIARIEAVLATKPPVDQDICTDASARWCMNCGDCTCPDPEDSLNHPDCPLHNNWSRHAGDGSLRAWLERLREEEATLFDSDWLPTARDVSEWWFSCFPDNAYLFRTFSFVVRRGWVEQVRLRRDQFEGTICPICDNQGCNGLHKHNGKAGQVIHGAMHSHSPIHPHHHCDARCTKNCKVCYGTGRVNLLDKLFAHPITRVVLDGVTPIENIAGPRRGEWFHNRRDAGDELWPLLSGRKNGGPFCTYDTRADAEYDLECVAAVVYGVRQFERVRAFKAREKS